MEFEVYDIALVPIIVFLTALVGRLGLPKKLLPIVVLVLSVVAGLVYLAPTDPGKGFLMGIALAMASVGAYSGAKNVFQALQ
ncbi:MAG: hypothetical protein Q8R28_04135 [Dehalococcoidia bacterium]|nr:hypothetical protein [Dehalococcoidia bacterium]